MRHWKLFVLSAAAAGIAAWLLAGSRASVGGSDAWKDAHGRHESFPWRLENGSGFDYEGPNCDRPCSPVVSRPDWTVSDKGRTYLLYEFEPGNMGPGMFPGEYDESLWIGLTDERHAVVRKIKLATGVTEISGIRNGLRGPFVTAVAASGTKTNIALRFPEPWPPLQPSGSAWGDFERRRNRLLEDLWEDWPGNGSGYAADWVSARMDEDLDREWRAAVEALKAAAPDDARRAELDAEAAAILSLVRGRSDGAGDEAGTVHWSNFTDRVVREQAMEPFLRNWLEASDDPAGWEAVRSATGTFGGEPFAATGGVAVLSLPRAWIAERWRTPPDAAGPETKVLRDRTGANSDGAERTTVLLRLAPAGAVRDGNSVRADYEATVPDVMDSGRLVERGTISLP